MKVLKLSAAAALALATGIVAHASGPIAVYAKVERVVMEPNEQAPERIQIYGVFSVAKTTSANSFAPPARGYLYYRLSTKTDNTNDNADVRTVRNEFRDLKAVAGTNDIVAFGAQWQGVPTVRGVDQKPESPDLFTLNFGIRKINSNTDFGPVKALRDFKP